jgi:hypothetical protein
MSVEREALDGAEDGTDWLSSLIALRGDIASGDERPLYLAWLLGVQDGEVDDEALEPGRPDGLGRLSPALASFVDIMGLDCDLLAAAVAEGRVRTSATPAARDLDRWLAGLARDEQGTSVSKLVEQAVRLFVRTPRTPFSTVQVTGVAAVPMSIATCSSRVCASIPTCVTTSFMTGPLACGSDASALTRDVERPRATPWSGASQHFDHIATERRSFHMVSVGDGLGAADLPSWFGRPQPPPTPRSRAGSLKSQIIDFVLAELFGCLFEQKACQLHRFDVHAASCLDAFRDRFQTLQGSRRQRDKPSFGPVGIRRSASASRHAKARLDVGEELHRPDVAAAGKDLPLAFCAKPTGDLVHVEARFHLLLLRELTDREILIANHQPNLSLTIAAHRSAEAREFGQVSGVLDVGARRVALHNDRLVFHQCPVSFIVAPDALRLRIGGRPSDDTTEHLQGSVDPAILVNRSRSITLDARDEQDDQHTFAPATEA